MSWLRRIVVAITVFGAGAIGGIAGACAALAGEDVTFVDRVSEHVQQINNEGLLISGLRGKEVRVKVKALEPAQLKDELDLVLLCVKSQNTVEAMDTLTPYIGPNSLVVSLQNGLNEEVIASYIGAQRTIGCLVDWGGDYQGPGHIQYSGDAPMRIGDLDGRTTKNLYDVQKVLNHTNATTITNNILGYLWSKIIWGNFYVGNALGKSTSIAMLEAKRYRPILLALFRESTAVAHAAGVKLEPLTEHNFDPIALANMDPSEGYAQFDGMADSFRGHAKVYSGPWRDIAVRKRPTEVDYILGPITKKGYEVNVPTPLNLRLIELVKEVESGRRSQNDANLLELEAFL